MNSLSCQNQVVDL